MSSAPSPEGEAQPDDFSNQFYNLGIIIIFVVFNITYFCWPRNHESQSDEGLELVDDSNHRRTRQDDDAVMSLEDGTLARLFERRSVSFTKSLERRRKEEECVICLEKFEEGRECSVLLDSSKDAQKQAAVRRAQIAALEAAGRSRGAQNDVVVVAIPLREESCPTIERRIVSYTKSSDGDQSNRIEECSICLEEFEQGCHCCELVECKHIYHSRCIDTWLNVDNHCPLCRHSVHGNHTYVSDPDIDIV
ncbi:hypothetical protein ACFE04_024149 [Oxalis oulophora]